MRFTPSPNRQRSKREVEKVSYYPVAFGKEREYVNEREKHSRTRARTTRWSGETQRESDGRSDECSLSEPLWFTLNGSLARTDAAWLEPWLPPSCGVRSLAMLASMCGCDFNKLFFL